MEKPEQNGDIEGTSPVEESLELAEEAEEAAEVTKKVLKVKNLTDDLHSDEEISQQETSEAAHEEVVTEGHVNGKVDEGESSPEEIEELESESQNLDASEGTQGIEEVIEVVEEIEIIEERQDTAVEEVTQVSEEEKDITEKEVADLQDEEEKVDDPKDNTLYAEQESVEQESSEEPDTQELQTEEDITEIAEEKLDSEPITAVTEDSEAQEEEIPKEVVLQSEDLVDSEQETKEIIHIVEREEVIPTKEPSETKEITKDNSEVETKKPAKEGLQRRRSSTESFQKLKDRFSNGTKVEENNKKNVEEVVKRPKEISQERTPKTPNMSDAKSKRFGGTSEKCTQCNRTVYPMEKMEVAGRLLHKTCFKCCKCNSQLSVGRFSIGGKDMYCMTHYKQAFREKGTYDVFTPDNPIKGKWENKAHE